MIVPAFVGSFRTVGPCPSCRPEACPHHHVSRLAHRGWRRSSSPCVIRRTATAPGDNPLGSSVASSGVQAVLRRAILAS